MDITHRPAPAVGSDRPLPLLDGRLAPCIHLDYAASRPARAGIKSRLWSAAYDDAHAVVARFVGADPGANTIDAVDAAVAMSRRIARGDSVGSCRRCELTGDFVPEGGDDRAPSALFALSSSFPAAGSDT